SILSASSGPSQFSSAAERDKSLRQRSGQRQIRLAVEPPEANALRNMLLPQSSSRSRFRGSSHETGSRSLIQAAIIPPFLLVLSHPCRAGPGESGAQRAAGRGAELASRAIFRLHPVCPLRISVHVEKKR